MVLAGIGWWSGGIDLADWHDRARACPGAGVFAALILLPLAGVPVSVMHAIVGARFGLLQGCGLVVASLVLQTGASYLLVRWLPRRWKRRWSRLHAAVPAGAHRDLTLFAALLPGAPFALQLYLVPLAGVPFATGLAWSLPIHALRALVGLVFGHWSEHLTAARLAGFGVYAVLVTLGCAYAFRGLQAREQHDPERQLEHDQGQVEEKVRRVDRQRPRL